MKAKKIHKYLGIPLCFLLFLAALSGIILNHRDLLQSIDIPRAVLPSEYKFEKWNNGAVRGVLRADSLAYIYGSVGVWVTDSSLDVRHDHYMRALSVAVTKLRSCLWREIQRAGYGSLRSIASIAWLLSVTDGSSNPYRALYVGAWLICRSQATPYCS